MNDQRWFSQEDLRVRLLTQDSGSFQGVIVEAEERAEGPMLVVDFPRASAPSLPIGSEHPLQIQGAALSSDLGGNGTIVLRSEDFFRQRYAFQIETDAMVPLAQAIQQRRSVRVSPSSANPVQVQLTTIDGANRCEPSAFDLSATGVSVRIPIADERRFFDAWDVKISLALTNGENVSFFGTVRHRRRVEDSIVLYGIEFDPAKTPGFNEKQEQILQYVATVQADNFRRARTNSGDQPQPVQPQANVEAGADEPKPAAAKVKAGPVRLQKKSDASQDGSNES